MGVPKLTIAWCVAEPGAGVGVEVVDDLKSLSVMFAALRSINLLNAEYGVRFEALLTDNGAEVASRGNVAGHPVERLLGELGITHRYTRPYRPQTNGKAGVGGR